MKLVEECSCGAVFEFGASGYEGQNLDLLRDKFIECVPKWRMEHRHEFPPPGPHEEEAG